MSPRWRSQQLFDQKKNTTRRKKHKKKQKKSQNMFGQVVE